jgi:CAAX protease family protein
VITAQPPVAAPEPVPARFWWRVLSPVAAVLAAFVLGGVVAGALVATPLGDDAVNTIASVVVSLAILLLALALRQTLPPHERRAAVALKHSAGGALGIGITVGIGILIGTVSVFALATAIDPSAEDKLKDIERNVGGGAWEMTLLVIALVVLAPLGEELLFRGLLLRGLAHRMRFWPAAVVTSVLFAVAHLDQYQPYPLWPRTLGLLGTGVALAWLYRWRGYPASVTAHVTVNVAAAVALIASA